MAIRGGDVSHWNQPSDVISRIKKDDLKFLIIKASEGNNYRDPKAAYYNKVCEMHGIMAGFYHYMRPELKDTTAIKEANNFVKTVEEITGRISSFNDGLLLAADWEGESLKCNTSYAYEWCEVVYELTGIKPLLYTGYAFLNDFKPYFNSGDFGLWCARWNNNPLKDLKIISPWKVVAIHQYTDSNGKFDYNMFNGTEEQLKLYGKSNKSGEVEKPTCPCKCGCCDS